MKAYIAGRLCNESERIELEKIEKICHKKGIETFLPHKECGLWKEGIDFKEISRKDIEGFNKCNILIANLNGFGIGAGTAWEMGYAHAKKMPVIGLKTDRKISDSIEEMSAIILGVTNISTTLKDFEKELDNLI